MEHALQPILEKVSDADTLNFYFILYNSPKILDNLQD